MTTAIVAEDEPHIRAQLVALLAQLWPDLEIVTEAEDGIAALAAIRAHEPDLLFLDVKMPGLSGVEVLQALGAHRFVTVFTTAFDDFAVKAFEEGAIDYLVKPITAARLAKAITRVQEKLLHVDTSAPIIDGTPTAATAHATAATPTQPLRWIQATQGDRVIFVTINEVLFFQSDSKYTRVVTKDREAFIRKSIKALIDELDPHQFVQVHRGTLINVNFIDVVERHSLRGMQVRMRGHTSALQIAQPYQAVFRGM
ncbi:MAG: DNA-binding response regulator [Betaproteobacteria bacterium]|nr:MAG: DNA-binding response regulator [Betaproteobacteria bacterium]